MSTSVINSCIANFATETYVTFDYPQDGTEFVKAIIAKKKNSDLEVAVYKKEEEANYKRHMKGMAAIFTDCSNLITNIDELARQAISWRNQQAIEKYIPGLQKGHYAAFEIAEEIQTDLKVAVIVKKNDSSLDVNAYKEEENAKYQQRLWEVKDLGFVDCSATIKDINQLSVAVLYFIHPVETQQKNDENPPNPHPDPHRERCCILV